MQLRRPDGAEEELQGQRFAGELQQQGELRDDPLCFAPPPAPLDRAEDEQVARIRDRNGRRHVASGGDELIGACAAPLDLRLDALSLDPRAKDARDCVERRIARRRALHNAHAAQQIVF